MKEELIRIEHGYFHSESGQYQFDVSIAHGECIGVYVDEHLTSGTAYLDIFKGKTVFTDGRAFCCGQRIGATGLERWIRQNAIVVDKSRFASKELTMRDFVLALVRTNHLPSVNFSCMVQRLQAACARPADRDAAPPGSCKANGLRAAAASPRYSGVPV